MKNSISKIMIVITLFLSFTQSNAQIKNSKTETIKIYGNCGMCQTKIENAGSIKKTAKVNWNVDTKMATLTYDATKTNQDEILKQIALAGYDSDKFLAPNDVYSKLPGCCQYDRVAKVPVKTDDIESTKKEYTEKSDLQETNQLKAIFDNYFTLKDALIKTDGNTAAAAASTLLSAINAVKMENLPIDEHMVWMKVVKNLTADATLISETKDVKKQRAFFDTLSLNSYSLIKISKQETPTYLQHCPMANDGKGADWLSKENAIKNPYYGSMMLRCGKTVETIK
ncbi:MAG: DUF3347 domain-containing protein [Flavobacteriaceae bacterium]|nr:DUF3347 domain-containing protein [Flavobacteriaceae bacterium]